MKLNAKEFKRFKELVALVKANKATEQEKAELAELQAKKNTSGSNDLKWWMNYPELVKDVTNLPFNWIPGTPVPITGPGNASVHINYGTIAIAEILSTIGRSVSDSDAFNVQMRKLWIDMHRKYRGLGAYQKADLGMAILAVNEFFKTLAKFERIYGVINTYHIGNRVVPYGLKDALGIGPDLEDKLADFRYTLNLYIQKAAQLCLPKGMSILMSDIVALSNIFKDSANRRAFLFGFDTSCFGIYDATSISTGGCVKYKRFDAIMSDSTPSGYLAFTLADVENILNMQLNALLSDDDITTICSDLIAAYGPENVMQLISVPTDYRVEPVQDYERSLQFHNLTIVGKMSSIYDNAVVDATLAGAFINDDCYQVIYQNNNVIYSRLGRMDVAYTLVGSELYPTYLRALHLDQGKSVEVLFDTWVDQPGDTEIMCGTRFTCLAGASITVDPTTSRQEIFAYGTNVVERLMVYSFDSATRTYIGNDFEGSVVAASNYTAYWQKFGKIRQMDWAPILYVNNSTDLVLVCDIDNFTRIDENNLQRLHDVALLSGYYIPMISKE